MAEFCLDCFNRMNGTAHATYEVELDEDFCEGCGEWKPCVISVYELYVKYRGDKPVAYRYGPRWQATALWMDGGYKTPEEAKLAWLREYNREEY